VRNEQEYHETTKTVERVHSVPVYESEKFLMTGWEKIPHRASHPPKEEEKKPRSKHRASVFFPKKGEEQLTMGRRPKNQQSKPQYPDTANPNKKLKGSFFSREKGSVYFGDHPIAFAVCLKSPKKKEIIRILLANGAFLSVVDRYGNTLLHLCVHHEDPEMYNYICDLFELHREQEMKLWKLKKWTEGRSELEATLEDIKNHKNRTPLTYAVAKGKKDMVACILSRRKQSLWVFGTFLFVSI